MAIIDNPNCVNIKKLNKFKNQIKNSLNQTLSLLKKKPKLQEICTLGKEKIEDLVFTAFVKEGYYTANGNQITLDFDKFRSLKEYTREEVNQELDKYMHIFFN